MSIALAAALSVLSLLLSFLVPALSNALLVVFDHFGTLVGIPEGPILRRNGGSAMLAIEAVATWALVVMQVVSIVSMPSISAISAISFPIMAFAVGVVVLDF